MWEIWSAVAPGDLDSAFKSPVIDGAVEQIVLQADGKILIAGSFKNVGGTSRPGLARLHMDGSLDAGFIPQHGVANPSGIPVTIRVALSGDQIVAGVNTVPGDGSALGTLVRLKSDGSLDSIFNPVSLVFPRDLRFANPLPPVGALTVLPDRKVLVGGGFRRVQETELARLARLNNDGTLDNSFRHNVTNDVILAVHLHEGGSIFVSGVSFSGFANVVHRLKPDGSADATFNAPSEVTGLANAIAVQDAGRLLLGGQMSLSTDVQTHLRLIALDKEGEWDPGFLSLQAPRDVSGRPPPDSVNSVVVQGNGKVLIGGRFATVHGIASRGIARLQRDGQVDRTFFSNPNVNSPGLPSIAWAVNSIALQADGMILLGGNFDRVNGVEQSRIARLYGGETEPHVPFRLDLERVSTTDDFRIILTGEINRLYVLEASTNLVEWILISDLISTNNVTPFRDLQRATENHRFYRAVLKP
jgi:uncharacterized delta-60 repeat protein